MRCGSSNVIKERIVKELRTFPCLQPAEACCRARGGRGPLDVALREKAWWFKEGIRARLVRYCAPSFSRHYEERIEVIFACVRRAVLMDLALMLIGQKYESVISLLQNSAELDVTIVEKLWKMIQTLPVCDVRAAVYDVLRRDEDGDYMLVLGG